MGCARGNTERKRTFKSCLLMEEIGTSVMFDDP